MPYRILSLDGGGVWALIEVRALLKVYGEIHGEAVRGHQVLSHFDMAVANSGGAIVLGGLLEDVALKDIAAYFENEQLRRSMFQPTSRVVDAELNRLLGLGPKYSAKAKLPALQTLLPNAGTRPLPQVTAGLTGVSGGADLHTLIMGFDYDRERAVYFRSADAGGAGWGVGKACVDVQLAQAIHASSNAPVNYFDEPAVFGPNRYWDGAIGGFNNPVLAGVVEAITLGHAPTEIVALSLGTGTVHLAGPPQDNASPFVQGRSQQDVAHDLGKLAGCITDDPPDAASFMAHVLTGGAAGAIAPADSRIVRLNPMVSPVPDGAGGWKPPGAWSLEQFEYLTSVRMDALDQHQVDYITAYTEFWLADQAPNQPLRMNGDTLVPELGYGTFSEAAAAWTAIS